MKKVFSKLACLRGCFIREGQRRGGQAVGSSALSRGFAARSLLSSAQLLLASQGFSIAFSLFFSGNEPGTNPDNFNCLQKTVKIVKFYRYLFKEYHLMTSGNA